MKPLWMKKLVKTIFGSVIKNRNKPTVSRTLQIEPLEIRLTPTVVSNVCGTLFVTGTSGVDNTFIWLNGTVLNIAEPSSLGFNLRGGNAFNSASNGGSNGVIGANGVIYDVLTINLANPDAADIFDNLTVEMGGGNDVLSLGFDPINGFATTGLDFTTLAATLTSTSVIVNLNGDSLTQTSPTLSGINTLNAGGIVSSYNSDLNIINFDIINNGDIGNNLLTLRASQGSLLIADPNLFLLSDGSVNTSATGTITLNNPFIDPVVLQSGPSPINIEASGDGNRIVINNPLSNISGQLFIGSQTNTAGDIDDILIKSIASNSSINPLATSINSIGSALTIQTLGDVYFEGSLDVNGLNVLETNNFTANGNVTSSYSILINSQTGNNNTVIAFNKNVVTDYDFTIYNLGRSSSSGAQFYINKDALDLGTSGLIFSVQCNFNAYAGATANATVSGGTLTAITVTNPGFGYLPAPAAAPIVTLSGGGGTGATATANIGLNGQITSINITNAGTGYTSSPTVSIEGSKGIYDLSILGQTITVGQDVNINNLGAFTLGTASNTQYSSATGLAVLGSGILNSITPDNVVLSVTETVTGTGYTSAPTVSFFGGGGTGAAATATLNADGTISYTVTSQGSGYTSQPTVFLTGGGFTTQASAVATLTSLVGSRYTIAPLVTFVGGGGTGAAATSVLGTGAQAGQVLSYNITNPGIGYTTAPTVILTRAPGDTTGSGASAIARITTINADTVTAINPVLQGSGYTSPPSVTIAGANVSAIAVPVLGATPGTLGQVTSISNIDGGSGYTFSPTVTISAPPSGGIQAVYTANILNGIVTGYTQVSAGSGYTSTPTITITRIAGATAVPVIGNGSGASANAIINAGTGTLVNIVPVSVGSGYTSIPMVSFIGGGGINAAATAVLGTGATAGQVIGYIITNPGSGYTSRPTVILTPTGAGPITSLTPVLTGRGYTSVPTVTITGGGGTGADYRAIISNGKVTSYAQISAGSGYTSAPTVTVTPAQITASASANLSAGTIPSLTPLINGLGYTSTPKVTITGGGGSGADYIAVLGTGAQAGTVVSYIQNPLNPNAAGFGYTSTPNVTVADPGTATAIAVLGTGSNAGKVIGYTITDVGFGYTFVPVVTVGPSPVVQNALLSAGGFFNALNLSTDAATTAATPFNLFSDITVQFDISTNRDIFVKAAATSVPIGSENRTFTVQSRAGDVSLAGNITMEDYTPITATALALLANGALSSISPILSGSGYSSAPLVTISAPSVGGTQATAKSVLGSGAQQGQVVSYTITNPGSGYTTTPTVTVAPNQVDATATSTLAGTSIVSITPVVLGSGYTSAPVVTITDAVGSGAQATAILGSGPTAGQVIGYVITNAGSGYVSPTITVASSSAIYGSNLTVWSGIATPSFKTKAVAGVPTILNGQVLAIPLTTQGVGYTTAPVVNIVGGGGSGATAIANLIPASSSATVAAPGITATALATVNNPGSSPNFGQVTSITPVVVGSNYSSKGFYSPTVTFPAPGITATATAVINAAAGTVTSVIVTNGGTNYNTNVLFRPLVTFIGGGGSGATATANVNAAGVVTSITINTPGTGYTSAPQVVIGTPGVTAQATANVVGGQITSYTITNPGSGYRVNPIPTISDPGITATATVTVGSGAAAGTIVAVSVVSFGGNYSQPPLVTIAPPPSGGIQATATAVLRRGFVRSIVITNPGSGYDSLIPNITITNPGSGYTSLPTITLTDPEGDISVQTVTGPNRTFTINDAKTFSATSTIQVKNLVLEALNDPNTFSVGEYVFNGNIGLTNNPTAINAMAGLYNIQFLGSANILGGGVGADSFSNTGQILLGNNSTDTFDFTTGVIFGQNTTIAGIASVDGNTTIRGNLTPGQVFGTGLPSASAILVSGAQAIATVAGGNLTALVGVVTGSGYTSAPIVTITGGGGLGATATAVLGSGTTAGQVVRYIITNSGVGYTSAPTVTITAPSGTGQLGAILPIDFGSGYTLAPAVIISGGGGTGASAVAILGTGIQAGQVVGYTITNPGAGYTSAPTISFASVGILTFISPLVFDNATALKSSAYSPVIIGNKAGFNQSQVVAQSGYTLTGNPRLSPSLGSLTATPGTAFTILNQLSGASSGKFSGLTDPSTNTYSVLNEGDIFYAGNATYKISYTGGAGSSVVLTFVRDTTGGNNFTAEVYYNSGVIEFKVTSTGIDVDATILSIFNTTANSITIDAGAGNSIQLTDYTSGNLNVSLGNTQTASIGLNNNSILGLKLLGNVGQDKFILQDLNSKVLLNSAASFGLDVDTSSYSGGEYQDTLTVDGTVKVFGTGNFKTSNNNPVQNLDEIIITSFGVIQSVGSGDILLVANHAPTSTISISSPPVSVVSPIILTASANAVLGSGTVISLTPAILGSGYTSVPAVSITGGGGTGAIATAVLGTGTAAGQVVSYIITNPGSGYTSTPTVTVAPPTSKSSFSLDLTSSRTSPLTSSGSVTLIAAQNISMGGNVVRTNGGSININAPVNLIGDTYLTTGNIKADVTFASTIDENFDLTVNSLGSLNFQGNVGSTAPLGDITTQSLTGLNVIGFSNGSNVPVAVNAASFNTAGGVSGNIVFSGLQNYSTTTGLNLASIKRNATIIDSGAAGDITLNGAISLITGAVLNLAHEAALNINANITNGLFTELSSSSSSIVNFGGQNSVTIISDAAITFNSPVNLGVDTNLQSTNNFGITFNNTLNGANDLAINTTGSLVFMGAVGATASLNSVSTKFTSANSTTSNNPLQLDVNNTLKVGFFDAMVNGDINMIQDQTYTGNGLTLVTVTPTSTIRLGKIIGNVSSAANVSVSNAGALILNDDIKLGGNFTQGALFTGISLTNAGSNYTSVPTVTISGGNGSGAAATASLGISAIKTLATATAIIAPLTATATATIAGGQLSGINPVSFGGGYVSAPAVTITGGGGTGATAIAVLGLTSNTAGQVVSYIVTNPGSGYSTSPSVTIDAPTFSVVTKIVSSYSGSGYASAPKVNIGNPAPVATAIATISNVNGVSGVSTVVPVFSGANFTSAPFVSITGGGGTGASAIAQLGTGAKAGQIVGYQVTNPGSGYITVPTVTVSENSATAIATVSAGTVSKISPVVLGNGYTSTPNVTVSSPGGVTAIAVATINSFTNTVSSVAPILPVSIGGGGGYTSVPSVTITGGGGTGASAIAVLGTGAHAGQVVSYTLTSVGTGYTSIPTVTVAPAGITATATAVLGTTASGTAGQIVSYNITNPGSGYTSAPSVTVDPAGKPATAVAILGTGLNSGRVVDYIVTYPGFGYSSAPVVTLSSMPSNSGIVISGSGYVVGDLVTLLGSGGTPANAQITNVDANGGVTGLTLLSSGKYTSGGLSGLVLISSTGRGKDGRVNATGFLQSISLTSAGSGYTSAPTISFISNNGVGATAIANLTSPTGQVYIGNLGNPSTITIKTGIDSDLTFTSKTYLNQNLLLDGSTTTSSDVSFGAIEGGTLSLLPALTIVAGGNLTFNGSIGAANPLGAIDASTNILSSVQSTSSNLGINAASFKFSATGVVSLTAPQHYTGTTLKDGSVFGLDLTNTTSSSLVTLGDITTREFFNTQVGSVKIDNSGNGYTTSPSVTFSGGGGTGATGSAFLGISNSSAVITSGGSGYTLNQIVQIVQFGFNNQILGSAIGQVTGINAINNGITALSILSSGYGFTDLTNLSVISSGFGGIGAGAIISASGFINAVNIISGGIGYTTAPTVVFSSGVATANALLAKKSNSVTISNAGLVTLQGDINTRGNFNQIGQGAVTIGTSSSGMINLNSAGGDVFFNTSVVQIQDFVVDTSISSANSGNITFNNSIDSIGFKAITLNSGVLGQQYQSGNILLKGSLGISPMGNIQVNNSNDFSVIGNVIGNSLVVNSAKGVVNFSGAITIRGTTPIGTNTVSLSMETISSASSVIFQSPVITLGNVIIKNAGTFVTTSIADMSIQGSFQQTGAGISSISGDISTTVGGISFAGPVGLSGTPKFIAKNTVSTSSLVDITFQNDVNGLGGISLDTTGRVLFLGNVGLLSPLTSIEIVNANYTNPLDLVAVQFNSSASQVTNANKIILPEPTISSNINGRVIFNGSTNISNAFTTTRSYYDIFFNSNVTFSTNMNFLNGGKVKFSGTTNFTGSATFNNSGTLEASGIIVSGGSLIVQRPLAITNNLQLYLSSSNNSFTSSVSGNSIVTINSGGTLIITGNSPQFTGNFVVNTNTINGVNSPSTLQVSAIYNNATVTLNGGTLSGTGRVLNVLSATTTSAIAVVGTGANAGKIRSINVTNPGSGYVSPPTVTIAAPPAGGTRATATAILGTGAFVGQIVGFSITNSGSGYTFAPSVTVSLPTAGGTFSPGAVLGNLTVGNQLVLGANNTFTTSINGVSPGTFGQTTIISGGSFGINNANLAIVLNTNLTAGNQIPLVNLGGGSSSLGNFTFNGTALTQGATFSISSNGYTNTFTISYTGGDGNDIVLTVSGSTASAPPPGSFTVSQVIGVDYGGGSVVQINYTNGTNLSFFAYSPLYTGGVRVALGDVNGDGIDELITGTGVGGGPHIKVFNLQGGQPVEIASFFAFEPTFMGGVNISTGDINGDGLADIIVGAGAGGGPRVKVFSGAANYFVNATTPLMDFFVYDPAFTGGVTVAAGNRDGYKGDEVITGSGFGGGPNIRSFNQFGQMVDNFFAFNSSITSGVFVAAGYVDSDAIADIIAGTGFGTPTQVAAFFSTGANPTAIPFVPNFVGGARVGVAINSSGKQVFAAAAGPGGAPQVNIFNNSLDTTNAFIAIDSLFSGGLFLNTSIYAAHPSLPNR
ncbi:MAG: VCBS repeat-containing protein [Planctomycetota bacterium]